MRKRQIGEATPPDWSVVARERKKRGNSISGRILADATYKHGRVGHNPQGCHAVLKLGDLWARAGRATFCSRSPLADNLFCGLHDHLNALFGDEEYLKRAFNRAASRGEPLHLHDDDLAALTVLDEEYHAPGGDIQ